MKPPAHPKKAAPAGKADKLANIIHSIAKSETHSPNTAMPSPELFTAFAKADPEMPEFFRKNFSAQIAHERRMERRLAWRHFMLQLCEIALPALCVLATAWVYSQSGSASFTLGFGMVTALIYGLRLLVLLRSTK